VATAQAVHCVAFPVRLRNSARSINSIEPERLFDEKDEAIIDQMQVRVDEAR